MRRRLLLFAVNRATPITPTTPYKRLPLSCRSFSSSKNNNNDDSPEETHVDFMTQMQELNDERQALFGFTKEEEDAWQNPKVHSSVLLDAVENARQSQSSKDACHHNADYRQEEAVECTEDLDSFPSSSRLVDTNHKDNEKDENPLFTHLESDNKSVNMVHVGQKQVTSRRAKARTSVKLPPEVMAAFSTQKDELVSPKGPIFATAKIAGIMAAK